MKTGINLGEMNAKLLAKIEELTLYLLQQQVQLNRQHDQIDAPNTLAGKGVKFQVTMIVAFYRCFRLQEAFYGACQHGARN